MRPEDLFLAIGAVEETRLARSELSVSSEKKQEDRKMKVKPTRILRNLLIAALLVSMLAVTAYAVTGFLIYDSPEEMIAAIFGDETGFDHNEGSIRPDPNGPPTGILVEPTFDRVAADEAVVAEDVAPYVDPVGQSIFFDGYTLTVDSFMYDSATKCGFVTYLLENPSGVSEYKLGTNGEIWYEGVPDIVDANLYGYPFIIQEKTTDTCLAATYYFKNDNRWGDNLELSFSAEEPVLEPEETTKLLKELEADFRKNLTPAQAIEEAIKQIGRAIFEENTRHLPDGMEMDMETYQQDYAYQVLTHLQFQRQYQTTENRLVIPLPENNPMPNIHAGNDGITVTPISMQIDVTDLTFLHEVQDGQVRVHADNVDTVVIRYKDGTEYMVEDGYILNYTFALCSSATEWEEDNYNMLTYMFNRIIDIDEVAAVIINGTELPVD